MGKVKCKDKVSIKKNLLLGIFYHLYLSYKEDKMNVNIYDFLMGVIVSISLLFFVLFYHIKLYKNHVFLKVWLLATGLVIIGFIISLLYFIKKFF